MSKTYFIRWFYKHKACKNKVVMLCFLWRIFTGIEYIHVGSPIHYNPTTSFSVSIFFVVVVFCLFFHFQLGNNIDTFFKQFILALFSLSMLDFVSLNEITLIPVHTPIPQTLFVSTIGPYTSLTTTPNQILCIPPLPCLLKVPFVYSGILDKPHILSS